MHKPEPKQSQDMNIILDSETKVFVLIYKKRSWRKNQQKIRKSGTTKSNQILGDCLHST